MNLLYYGDNLDILREYIRDESIDLIYLDPPFNSKATYNVLFAEQNGTASAAQVKAFEDTWHWDTNERTEIDDSLLNPGVGPMKFLLDGGWAHGSPASNCSVCVHIANHFRRCDTRGRNQVWLYS